MCASWIGNYNIDLLARKLEDAKRSSSGLITFEGTAPDDAVPVLLSALHLSAEVPETQRIRILYETIFIVGAAGKITKSALLAEIGRRESSYLRAQERPFTVATTLSIRYFDQFPRARFRGCYITPSRRLPELFRREHEGAVRQQLGLRREELPTTGFGTKAHTAVRATVRARTEHEAALAAVDALTLLRGLWNLFLNLRRQGPPLAPVPRKPVNRVLLGPAHTVHESDGNLATPAVWFETSFQRTVKPYKAALVWPAMKGFELDVRTILSRARYPQDLERAIRRYTEALDLTDWNASFVQLWSLLEYLTGSGHHYDKTIKRILFVCRPEERDFHREILKHLRDYRNTTVHRAEHRDDILPLVFVGNAEKLSRPTF